MGCYKFGPFLLNPELRVLSRDGEAVDVTGKTLETLMAFVQNRGKVMDKDELMSILWPETVVEEANLTQHVSTLRKILGDNPKDHRYIVTIPGRGYQFVAPVIALTSETPQIVGTVREAPQEPASDSIIANLTKRRKKAAMRSVAVVAALVALTWFLRHHPPKTPAELTQKRLTFNASENHAQSAAISPDGKYLAYSDAAGIHVKLLSTGEERLIPRPAGVSASTYWLVDSWFPDGTQLLADADDVGAQKSMWTVPVLGHLTRELREGVEGFEVSPDGKQIAFRSAMSEDIHEIWLMGIQGDNPQKVLAVGENETLRHVHWSPDGQRLAYIRVQRSSDRFRYSIETCDLKGTNRTVVVPADLLVQRPSREVIGTQGFCWLPDGRIVYARSESEWRLIEYHRFREHRSTDDNLWQIGIDNRAGTPTGKPRRITQWAGSYLGGLSASADGKRLVLAKQTYQAQVYLGELVAGGTRMKPPRRLTNDETNDVPTAWTADSKAVLFGSNRNGPMGIFKQGISQETSEPVVTGPEEVELVSRLSADGAWILFVEIPRTSANPAPAYRLMRIPASGGVARFVQEMRNLINFECARAPASLCVSLEASQDRKKLMITAFDPLKGRGKVLRTIEIDPSDPVYQSALSPDGSTFAISPPHQAEIHIRLLSLSGGSDREITLNGWPNNTSVVWSQDGKGLYCGSVSSQGGTLLYVDRKGNARVLWQYKGGDGAVWGIPSPDGRYLAIRRDVINSNVWMVEGF
jgi:DNA-binding winged helix-turn-helix (wHTH) protein/Tol biopolymer transport system component